MASNHIRREKSKIDSGKNAVVPSIKTKKKRGGVK